MPTNQSESIVISKSNLTKNKIKNGTKLYN